MNRITYPLCSVPEHASQPLSRICLDSKCDNRTVICCLCEYESHPSHQTIPIKHFLNKFEHHTNIDEPLNPLHYATQLNQIRHRYFQLLAKLKLNIIDHFQELQTKGHLYFNRCQETLLNLSSLNQPLSYFTNQISLQNFQSYFAKILLLYNSEDKTTFSLKQKFDTFMTSCRLKQKTIIENIDLLKNDANKNIDKIKDLIKEHVELIANITSLKWSETLKGAKIKITGPLVEQTGNESAGQRFGLIEESLPNTGKVRWGIRVKKFVGWVGLGICLKNLIKVANYHFNYTNVGHGSYLISTNGYSWSHSVKELNSTFKTFQFTINDVVYIEYDPKEGKLRFRKNLGPEKFELDVVPPPSGDSYHPCINLCSTGDAAELVYPGMPLS